MNKALSELEKELGFEAGGNGEYEIKAINDNAVYGFCGRATQKKKTPESLHR